MAEGGGIVLLGIIVILRLQHIQITTSIWEYIGIGAVLRERGHGERVFHSRFFT